MRVPQVAVLLRTQGVHIHVRIHMWGFPRIRGVVLRMKIIVFLGLNWGPPIDGN